MGKKLAKSDLQILKEFWDNDAVAVRAYLTPRLGPRGFTDAEIHELVEGVLETMLGEFHADVAANPGMLWDLASGDDEANN